VSKRIVTLDERTSGRVQLIVGIPADQQEAIRKALAALAEAGVWARVQRFVSEALLSAIEQRYFWTAEWQAKEREFDEATAAGRVQAVDSADDMIALLDAQ
jgi:hypothetical protein